MSLLCILKDKEASTILQFVLVCFWDRVLRSITAWIGTWYVDQVDRKLTEIYQLLASWVLGLKSHVTTPSTLKGVGETFDVGSENPTLDGLVMSLSFLKRSRLSLHPTTILKGIYCKTQKVLYRGHWDFSAPKQSLVTNSTRSMNVTWLSHWKLFPGTVLRVTR